MLEEVPDVTYDDVGGLDDQIDAIKDAVELPYLYAEMFHEHELQPPKGILLYGPPGCGKTLIAKAVANSLAQRVAEKTGNTDGPLVLPQHQGPRAPQQVRRRDRAPDPPHLPAGAGEVGGGLPGHRVLRRDGLPVPHPRHRHLVRHREHDRAAAARRDRRRREPEERDRDRRLEPRGPHRPGDPAPGPPRREDQDRAARRGERRDRSSRQYLTPNLPLADEETGRHGGPEKAVAGHDRRRRSSRCTPSSDANRFLEVDVPERRQGDPLLQGLLVGRHDREHRAAREEALDQAPDRGRGEGHRHPGPARLDPPGVPRARGPAEHHEPRRLGEDLRARRASASSSCARSSPRATRPTAAARSNGSPPASTSSRDPRRARLVPAVRRCSHRTDELARPQQPDRARRRPRRGAR